MRRVAITGAGTINALGQDVAATYAAFAQGRCGIGVLDIPDLDRLSVKIGAQVRNWHPEAWFTRSQIAQCDRFALFALFAAQQAVTQSGLDFRDLATQSGVILGTAGGGLTTTDDSYRAVYLDGKSRVPPLVVPRLMHNAAAAQVSMAHGITGPVFAVSTACASSNHAMGLAFQMVRAGGAVAVLTGGSEAMLSFGGLKAWEALRVMSPDACRPFSADRTGMVQGEGAAVFVFEDMDHALARGATVLGEIFGFAMTSDAVDLVAPSKDGAMRAMRGALQDAQVSPSDIGYINAHGTGTTLNDRTECAAIAEVFGSHVDRLLVSSTKSMHGHLIGGTGAVELLACLMALNAGIVPPTIGHRAADPDCALDVVANIARKADVSVALSNAFAFGGLNAVLVVGRTEARPSPS
jgi:nodulation protein E